MERSGPRPLAAFVTLVLDVSWYGVLVGFALAACLAAYSIVGDLSGASMDIPVSFGISSQTIRVDGSSAPAQAVLRKARGAGDLTFTPPPSRAFLLAASAGLFGALLLAAWILAQLRAVFRTVRDGHPFVPANADRIRRIGYIVIAGELGRDALSVAGARMFAYRLSADGLAFGGFPQVNLLAIFAGLVIIAIAEVFREGTRLDEEQSLTI